MPIYKRKKKDGSTVYDVVNYMGFDMDGNRVRKSVTVRSMAAAKVEDAKMVAERDAMRGRSGRMELRAYVERRYWPSASRRLAATSLETYEKEIRLRILPSLGSMDVRDIDRVAIQRMVDKCPTEGVARKCLGVLKTILNEARGDGLLIKNPCAAKFAMPPKGPQRPVTPVLTTFEEIGELLSIVRHRASDSLVRICYTGLLEGLRPEERYALDWADLDVDDGMIYVHSAYVKAPAAFGGVQMKPTKTEKSRRAVPMHPAFAEWMETLGRGDGPFILGAHGSRISPSTAQHRWAAFLRDNPDAPRVTIENMRHSFATAYLHAGGNIEDLSRILGHADINTTFRRYVKPSTDDLVRGMDRISGALPSF